MTPTAITELANNYASKDDRYLMIVAVLLLIAGGALVIHYLVDHLKRLQTRNEAQTEQLIQVAISSQSTADSCRQSIDANTKMLERVDDRLRER